MTLSMSPNTSPNAKGFEEKLRQKVEEKKTKQKAAKKKNRNEEKKLERRSMKRLSTIPPALGFAIGEGFEEKLKRKIEEKKLKQISGKKKIREHVLDALNTTGVCTEDNKSDSKGSLGDPLKANFQQANSGKDSKDIAGDVTTTKRQSLKSSPKGVAKNTKTTRRNSTARHRRRSKSMSPKLDANTEGIEEDKLRRKNRPSMAHSSSAQHNDHSNRSNDGARFNASEDKFEKQMIRLHLRNKLAPTLSKNRIVISKKERCRTNVEISTRRLASKRAVKATRLGLSCPPLGFSWRCFNCTYINESGGLNPDTACKICREPKCLPQGQGRSRINSLSDSCGVLEEVTFKAACLHNAEAKVHQKVKLQELEDDTFYNVPARVFTRSLQCNDTQKRVIYSRVLLS